MGSKARRQRRREQVRETILAAARELGAAGYDQLSMRRLAERVEYTPTAIYDYFPAKRALLRTVAEEGWRRLAESLDTVPESADPVTRLRWRLWNFYEFSRTYPADFELMFIDREVGGSEERWDRLLRESQARVGRDLLACVADGCLREPVDPTAALNLLCAGMVGVAMMYGARHTPDEGLDALAHALLDALITALVTDGSRRGNARARAVEGRKERALEA